MINLNSFHFISSFETILSSLFNRSFEVCGFSDNEITLPISSESFMCTFWKFVGFKYQILFVQ